VSRKYPIKTNPLTLFGQFRARLGRYAVGFGLLLSYQVAQFWFDKRLMRAVDACVLRNGWQAHWWSSR